jgi:hypothetical protein
MRRVALSVSLADDTRSQCDKTVKLGTNMIPILNRFIHMK